MKRTDESMETQPTWSRFADLHDHLNSPLSPAPQDVETVRRAIAGSDGNAVLLGVTPALAGLGQRLVAYDQSARMVETVWPGDDATRRAYVADWRAMPLESGSIDAVIGDGSLNSVAEGLPELLAEIARVLRPGGRTALRTFCAPEAAETLATIRRDVEAGWPGNFHALKWRIAMALGAERPLWTVPVDTTRQAFEAMFPDRNALAKLTGWSRSDIDTIDFYVGADHSLNYPPLSALLAMAEPLFERVEIVRAGGYPLAERCPVIIFTR